MHENIVRHFAIVAIMNSDVVERMMMRYPIISDQVDRAELRTILDECVRALTNAEGDVVELGCYIGTTSLFLARVLSELGPKRRLHVYDSFAGLPEKTPQDASPAGEQFKAGELFAQKSEFIRHFKQAGLQLPVIHKGWFSELTEADMPAQISFAFLDGDYYSSVKDSLAVVWPMLSKGGIVVVDDYTNEALPGARRAVDEWLVRHPADLQSVASLAVIRPRH